MARKRNKTLFDDPEFRRVAEELEARTRDVEGELEHPMKQFERFWGLPASALRTMGRRDSERVGG